MAKNLRSRFGTRLVKSSSASSSGLPRFCSSNVRLNSPPIGSDISCATRLKPAARLCPARSARAISSSASGSWAANFFSRRFRSHQQPHDRQHGEKHAHQRREQRRSTRPTVGSTTPTRGQAAANDQEIAAPAEPRSPVRTAGGGSDSGRRTCSTVLDAVVAHRGEQLADTGPLPPCCGTSSCRRSARSRRSSTSASRSPRIMNDTPTTRAATPTNTTMEMTMGDMVA